MSRLRRLEIIGNMFAALKTLGVRDNYQVEHTITVTSNLVRCEEAEEMVDREKMAQSEEERVRDTKALPAD